MELREINDTGDAALVGFGFVVMLPVLLFVFFKIISWGGGSVVDEYEKTGNLEGLQKVNEESNGLLKALGVIIVLGILGLMAFGDYAEEFERQQQSGRSNEVTVVNPYPEQLPTEIPVEVQR